MTALDTTSARRPAPARPWRTAIWRALPYALLAAAALWLWLPRSSGPAVGLPAADFALPAVAAGEPGFRLADHRGEPVLVEVFASWCGVCRTSAPTLTAAVGAERERSVAFVAVSVDEDPASAHAAARDWGLALPVVQGDAQFSRDYAVTALPTFILIDAEGKVAESATGAIGRARLERWLAGVGAAKK